MGWVCAVSLLTVGATATVDHNDPIAVLLNAAATQLNDAMDLRIRLR